MELDFKASLVAVLVAVVDVLPEHLALDAQVGVQGQVGELQRHQRLQVVGVQQLPVVRVILQGEAAADAVVLDLSDLTGILLFLQRYDTGAMRLCKIHSENTHWDLMK